MEYSNRCYFYIFFGYPNSRPNCFYKGLLRICKDVAIVTNIDIPLKWILRGLRATTV